VALSVSEAYGPTLRDIPLQPSLLASTLPSGVRTFLSPAPACPPKRALGRSSDHPACSRQFYDSLDDGVGSNGYSCTAGFLSLMHALAPLSIGRLNDNSAKQMKGAAGALECGSFLPFSSSELARARVDGIGKSRGPAGWSLRAGQSTASCRTPNSRFSPVSRMYACWSSCHAGSQGGEHYYRT